MSKHMIFARLTKVDEAARTVTGIAASEATDASGEIFDYETSKPHFEKWSGDIGKATGGKSIGNIRAMHGSVAAGKVTDINFDDAVKTIEITAHIVDDNEFKKVLEGVYTGFSIGGKYVKKWADAVNGALKRYTAQPVEISIVDLPCNSDCYFSVVKASGVVEQVQMQTLDDAQTLAKFHAATSVPELLKLVAEDHGHMFSKLFEPPDARTAQAMRLMAKADEAIPLGNAILAALGKETIEKSLWTISAFADVLCTLCNLTEAVKSEAAMEGDASPVPAKLAAVVSALSSVFLEMAAEEVDEAMEMTNSDVSAHTSGNVLYAAAAAADLQKAADDLQKLTHERDELQKKLDTTAAEVNRLKALPAMPKGVLHIVSKSDDVAAPVDDAEQDLLKRINDMPEGEDKVKAQIMLSYRRPMGM